MKQPTTLPPNQLFLGLIILLTTLFGSGLQSHLNWAYVSDFRNLVGLYDSELWLSHFALFDGSHLFVIDWKNQTGLGATGFVGLKAQFSMVQSGKIGD